MVKNENTIFWIIGIVVVVLFLNNSGAIDLFAIEAPEEEGMVGLNIHYYKNNVEVYPTKGLFSIVTPPGGSYDQIAFSISATNKDIPLIDIKVVDASPQAFKDALPTTTQTLATDETKTLWTSDLIDTVQFEGQTINFWIDVSGKNTYTDETISADRAYSGDISFEAEGEQEEMKTIFVLEDSSTHEGFPSRNEGDEDECDFTKNFMSNEYAYLKFDLSSIPSNAYINNIKLHWYLSSYSGSLVKGIKVSEVGDSWSEGTITWSNQPSVIYDMTAESTSYGKTWMINSLNLDNFINDGFLSLRIWNPGSSSMPNYGSVESKEGSATLKSYIEVRYEIGIYQEYQENANSYSYETFGVTEYYPNEAQWGVIYFDYNKPQEAISATWKVKHGKVSDLPYEISLPTECFNLDPIKLKIISHNNVNDFSHSTPYCYNGNDWIQIGNSLQGAGAGAYNFDYVENTPERAYDGNWDTGISWAGGFAYFQNWFKRDIYNPGEGVSIIFEEGMIWNKQN